MYVPVKKKKTIIKRPISFYFISNYLFSMSKYFLVTLSLNHTGLCDDDVPRTFELDHPLHFDYSIRKTDFNWFLEYKKQKREFND